MMIHSIARVSSARRDTWRRNRSTGHRRRMPLVGRARELKALTSWIASTQPGIPRIAALHGSPGSGKSALLDLALDRLRASEDACIIGGQCQAWESVPLNAIDVIVDSLSRELRRQRSPAVDEIL